MKKAKCKFYNSTKGFGFLVDSENGTEIFVHATGLVDDIREDDEVTYEVTEGKKGLNAEAEVWIIFRDDSLSEIIFKEFQEKMKEDQKKEDKKKVKGF